MVGGAAGFGASLGMDLMNSGANLFVLDRSPLGPEYSDKAPSVTYKKIDLTKGVEILKSLQRWSSSFKLDGIVYLTRGRERYPLEEYTAKKRETDFLLNLDMFLEIVLMLNSHSRLSPGCSIVTISSVCSNLIGSESLSYHISKAALESSTKYLAHQLGALKIRVNCVQLGFIVKDEHKPIFYSAKNKTYKKWAEGVHPLGRVGHTSDVVDPIVFLLSEKSAFITGQIITVDGGLTLQEPSYLAGKMTGIIK